MTTLPNHLFIADDGALYDTRRADWSSNPLRPNYRRGHSRIASVADLKAALRHGSRTDLGAYPLYFVMADGESLSFESARANLRELISAIQTGLPRDGWTPVAIEINYEDGALYCAHSNERIPSAYAEEEEPVN